VTDARAIERAAALVAAGHLVAFPTETVYGLGAAARNEDAIRAVFRAKGRPADNPLIVHGADRVALEEFAVFDERARAVADALWPGPLTLVLPVRTGVSPLVTAGLPTVAVRVPDHPLALALLRATGPLVAPSANRSGRPSPTTAAHVRSDLGVEVALILDGGACRVGIESTVLDLTGPTPTILRPGIIDATVLQPLVGPLMFVGAADAEVPRSPGMKYRHYAPSIPVHLVIAAAPPSVDDGTYVLTPAPNVGRFPRAMCAELTAATLYDELRRAEESGAASVLVFARPGELGEGMLDRVRKAAEDAAG
jgi:L-threonylcarbamoyladenylate synthase